MFRAPTARTLRTLSVGIVIAILLAAFPWRSGDLLGFTVAVVWSLFAALLLIHQIRRSLLMTATSTASFVLAYSLGIGDAVADGATARGITASPLGVMSALVALAGFLFVVTAVSRFVRDRSLQFAGVGADPAARDVPTRPDVEIALFGMLVVCFVAAVAAEMWTSWGGERAEPVEQGGIRLELLYPSVLLAIVGYGALGRLDRNRSTRYPLARLVIFGVVAILLFVLQSRRIMIAGATLVALAILVTTPRGGGRRLALQLAAVAVVITAFTLASSGWRNATDDPYEDDPGMSQRLERAVEAVTDAKSFDTFESRLTYLWFDGMTQDLCRDQGATLDGGALLASNVAAAIPRVLFPAKDAVAPTSCENGLEGFWGMDVDLPCTPAAEGYLIGGPIGVLLAALLWGLSLGIAEASVARGPGLWRIFGLFMFLPLSVIETGVFAIVQSLRIGLLGVLLVGVLSRLARLFPRLRPTPTAGTSRTTGVAVPR